MNLFNSFWQMLFPEECLGCRKSGTLLCFQCLAKIPPPKNSLLDIYSFFDYRNEVIKKAIWQLKYRNKKIIAKVFAKAVSERLLPELSELETFANFDKPVLVPIPLSRSRDRGRGYNQAALLAEEISKEIGFSICQALIKVRETPTQVSIRDRAARLANLRDAFSINNKEKIRNRDIFVVDDVTTTGATIEEARRVLLAAGARKVFGLTIAH